MDMNDRALRSIVIGLGGHQRRGRSREDRFVIVPGSEIMAILAWPPTSQDLEARLGRIIVGLTRDRKPVTAGELKAAGAMTLLLKDAILPNLVQTLEGGPAMVHCGPFGNIAHGCNSIAATRLALGLGDIVLTEAGFGADLGAEKFFDIKCRFGGLNPEAAIVVATIRALKMHGGVKKDALGKADVEALKKGLVNLEAHVRNVQKFGVPVVVALNRFTSDTQAEIDAVLERLQGVGRPRGPERRLGQGRGRRRSRRQGSPRGAGREEGGLQAALRRGAADQGQDRDDREGDLRRGRRRLRGGGGEEHRPARGHRAGADARCAWPRRSTRSPTIRPSSDAPPASGSPSGTSIPRRAPASWWRWPETS